jgi:protein-S-isoprenylcysteine O-methyltransferase Ste14
MVGQPDRFRAPICTGGRAVHLMSADRSRSGNRMARYGIRPSTTQNSVAVYAKSVLNAVLFFAIFMVAVPWLAYWLVPRPVPLPFWARLTVGGPLVVGGLGLWMLCLDAFSRRGAGTPFPLDAPRNLVTTGPHGWMRNPIMVGELAVIWGEALLLSALGVWLYAALISLGAHLAVVYVEEPELRQRFGEQYVQYCRRVPRWPLRRARTA